MAATPTSITSSSVTREEDDHLHGNHHRRRHVWTWTYFRSSMEDYLCKSPDKLRELVVCIAVYWIGWNASNLFLRRLIGIRMRPIPYQTTKTGEVIIDLALSNEMIGLDDVQIPSHLLEIISFWLPLTVMGVIGYCFPSNRHDLHSSVCALLLGSGTSEFITKFFKLYIGRLRPNFYSMCQFDFQTKTCMASMEMQEEARMSFPSGHSSLSFCGMTMLSLYLAGKVAIGAAPGPTNSNGNHCRLGMPARRVSYYFSFSPLLLSSFVATSRLVDNWHHPSDVVAGCCLGAVCALLCYHMWYPNIWSPQAGIPLSVLNSNHHSPTPSSDASEVGAEVGPLLLSSLP